MSWDKTTSLIGLISLCFLLILGVQIYWLKTSQKAIEDQFNQKVSLALGSVVEEMEACTPEACMMHNLNCQALAGTPGSQPCLHRNEVNMEALDEAVACALQFYDLPLDFQLTLIESCDDKCDPSLPNCCSLIPFNAEMGKFMHIEFPGRSAYVWNKMGIPLISSILVLLFIFFVFILTIRSLLAQRKIATFNKDFFNNMAHEFRTPLANIRLALSRVKQKGTSEDSVPYLKIIETENQKLNANVERVLSLAKLDNGHYELRKEQVDITQLLDKLLADMNLLITEAGAKIHIDPSVEKYKVWADPLHISHAFRNLIDNAIKYCDTRPELWISMQTNADGVNLIFKDNGIGMDENEINLVFDRFSRIDHDHPRKGYGLGLSYVQMIVDLHKGKINLWSTVGEGSTFQIFFPKIA